MKRLISALLSLLIIVSFTVFPTGAVTYDPDGPYTVSLTTPTCEEALEACGYSLSDTQKIYFQLPAEDPDDAGSIWTNHYNSTDLGLDYCQVCVYWWMGAGSQWQNGAKVQWVGYRAKLVDKENRIYEAAVPADGNTPNIVVNNGVNGGSDTSQEIFSYARQLQDANVEGAHPGDYDTLTEGTPDPNSMDGCIMILDQEDYHHSSYVSPLPYAFNWYVYYGCGCYGSAVLEDPDYYSRVSSCCNPEHFDENGNHIGLKAGILGDVDNDGEVSVIDATLIQRFAAHTKIPADFNAAAADIDGSGAPEIIDATLIQRYLVQLNDAYPIGEPLS